MQPSRLVRHVASIAVLFLPLIAVATPAQAATHCAWSYGFNKNPSSNVNSKFGMLDWWDANGACTSVYGTWNTGWSNPRAGSGKGTQSQWSNDCLSNYGWIPDGWTNITAYSYNWPGTVVRGPVLRLADRTCHNGTTLRTELFVHSSFPWDVSRYASEGCIKLSNTGGPNPASGDVWNWVNDYEHNKHISWIDWLAVYTV